MKDTNNWEKQDISTQSKPLIDEPDGQVRFIRQFEFSFNPLVVKQIRNKQISEPSRQELFNAHIKQIEIMLWGDGLVPDSNHEPRLVVGKKKYKIIIACKLRQGVILGRGKKVNTLTDVFAPKKSLT